MSHSLSSFITLLEVKIALPGLFIHRSYKCSPQGGLTHSCHCWLPESRKRNPSVLDLFLPAAQGPLRTMPLQYSMYMFWHGETQKHHPKHDDKHRSLSTFKPSNLQILET